MKKTSEIKDSDLKGVETALQRSAKNALKLARSTRTPCYVMEDGKMVDVAQEK